MAIRPINVADLPAMLEWRNTPAVRESMVNTGVIDPDQHLAWFERIRSDRSCKWIIVSDDNGPIGVAYLTDIKSDSCSARWGFYKVPGLPPGTGTRLCRETLSFAFDTMRLRAVVGDVRRTNAASIRMHEKLGFERQVSPAVQTDGPLSQEMIRFVLQRDRWELASYSGPVQRVGG